MGRRRKIPVRKHHGVRDPLKQLEEKEKRLKNLINNPPPRGAEEKISHKFAEFKKLVDDSKAGRKMKRIPRGVEDTPSKRTKRAANEGRKFPNIRQMEGETDVDYLRRVNRITRESLKEAQYEIKYGVSVVRNPKTGEISIQKKPKNEIDQLLEEKRKEHRHGRKKGTVKATKPVDPKAARELIKRAIKEDEEERKREDDKEVEGYKRDFVKFGEVVHGPPTLSTLPRKAQKNETVPRPGQKKNLILKSIFDGVDTSSNSNSSDKLKSKNMSSARKLQLNGKRKNLPTSTRHMLEKERENIVALYRNMKKSKLATSTEMQLNKDFG